MDSDVKAQVLDKVDNFNIKCSILEFVRNIANYQCSLKKHFRGYMEIIGYSNEYFYQNSLQVMKIRGKKINEVLQFHIIEPDIKHDLIKNTNLKEAEYILEELKKLKKEEFKGTVGIISPFSNQQKIISDIINNDLDIRFFEQEFQLKVMTFDSCQGEERDIIYYSMVERPEEDTLKYIFPVNMANIDDEEEGSLKAQRLNVGFSRAKESVRFIMSKTPEEVNGEVGKALRYYKLHIEQQDHAKIIEETDKNSPMESAMYNFLIQTPFYKENYQNIEVIPQFNLGKYIKQLDPYAKIPNYRTDFLFIYKEEDNSSKMIILEYDGFEYHFKDNINIDTSNFDKFHIESDVERQKTIESYGYDFIRLNKFLMRDNPIEYLNNRLENFCKKKVQMTIL